MMPSHLDEVPQMVHLGTDDTHFHHSGLRNWDVFLQNLHVAPDWIRQAVNSWSPLLSPPGNARW